MTKMGEDRSRMAAVEKLDRATAIARREGGGRPRRL
jgi:hypothetical protein